MLRHCRERLVVRISQVLLAAEIGAASSVAEDARMSATVQAGLAGTAAAAEVEPGGAAGSAAALQSQRSLVGTDVQRCM